MRDLFEYIGYPMTEAMAFGLDASLGFVYFNRASNPEDMEDILNNAPFFFGGKQGTIESTSLACRILGLLVRKQSFSSPDKVWAEAKKMIDQDIPLILKVDMAYLPYFQLEEGEIHFGGHAITLVGYDENKGIVLVGESNLEGFQEVPIEDLKKCRSSDFGPKFMRPNNTQFSIKPRPDGKRPPFAAGIKLAIQQVVSNMLRPSINNFGVQGLKLFAKSIPEWKNSLKGQVKDTKGKMISIAPLMFEFAHGYIETWGTGGAAFRNLYRDFLMELLNCSELKKGERAWQQNEFEILEECLSLISISAENWTKIATQMLDASKHEGEDCLNQINLNELHELVVSIAMIEEELFLKLSKIKI